jgi:tRNA(Ile)-lysidine synthase
LRLSPVLHDQLLAAWPTAAWADVTTLIGVSGGPDSVALLRALHSVRPANSSGRLVVAHFNHRWRGAASDADEAFVVALAGRLSLECVAGRAEATADSEEEARDQRYAFLRSAAHQSGARYVAVGHTADDQAETILFRVARGTGLSGLAGMPAHRALSEAVTLVRPLLTVRRADVVAYLEMLQQPSRADSSNGDTRFARNYLRREVLPALQTIAAGDIVENLVELGRRAAEALEPIQAQARKLLDECLEVRGDAVSLRRAPSANMPSRMVMHEMFVELWRRQGWPRGEMNSERWERLAAMWLNASGRAIELPGRIRVACSSAGLYIRCVGQPRNNA